MGTEGCLLLTGERRIMIAELWSLLRMEGSWEMNRTFDGLLGLVFGTTAAAAALSSCVLLSSFF